MLYFSRIRIYLISLFSLVFIYLAVSNFISSDDNFLNKKINLGLDLQGGSYLLLEIDNSPVITQKLQNTVSILRKFFKDKDIDVNNLRLENTDTVFFNFLPKE